MDPCTTEQIITIKPSRGGYPGRRRYKMITQYFATQAQAWAFALDLDKTQYQVIDYGKMDSALPYYVSYAKR